VVEDVPDNRGFGEFALSTLRFTDPVFRMCYMFFFLEHDFTNVLYAYVLRGILEVGCVCVFIDTSVYVCEHHTMI